MPARHPQARAPGVVEGFRGRVLSDERPHAREAAAKGRTAHLVHGPPPTDRRADGTQDQLSRVGRLARLLLAVVNSQASKQVDSACLSPRQREGMGESAAVHDTELYRTPEPVRTEQP